MRQYWSATTTRARAAPWIKSAGFSVIVSTQALMWAETKDRAWPRHRRRAALRRPARAIQDRTARPRPIPSGWCPPDDARSGNAAGDRGGGAAAVQRARLFCDQSLSRRCNRPTGFLATSVLQRPSRRCTTQERDEIAKLHLHCPTDVESA